MIKLRLNHSLWDRIENYHTSKDEKISFLFANAIKRGKDLIIVVSGKGTFPDTDHYISSSPTHLNLYKGVMDRIMSDFAESSHNVLINIHHHPFSQKGTTFSSVDNRDDVKMDRYLREELILLKDKEELDFDGRELFNLSIVLDQNSFDARLTDIRKKPKFQKLDQVQCIGRKLIIKTPNSNKLQHKSDSIDSRQDFIGQDQLQWLKLAKVGVCGAGGLGSIYCEGLLRLGVRNITLIDDDRLEISNLNRFQTGQKSQVGQAKVDVLRDNLQAMEPEVVVQGIQASIASDEAIQALTACDIIIGGTDNHFSRAILNHLSVQYLIPYFDAGVEVIEKPEVNFRDRLFVVTPGESACMECTPFSILDSEQVVKSFLNTELENEFRYRGYITEQAEVKSPSVYPLNQVAAGTLLIEFLNYIAGFKAMGSVIHNDYQRGVHERSDDDNFPENHPQEDCPVCSFYTGKGDSETLPFKKNVDPNQFFKQQIEKGESELFTTLFTILPGSQTRVSYKRQPFKV